MFLLCILNNINQTAAVLLWLEKTQKYNKTMKQTNSSYMDIFILKQMFCVFYVAGEQCQ